MFGPGRWLNPVSMKVGDIVRSANKNDIHGARGSHGQDRELKLLTTQTISTSTCMQMQVVMLTQVFFRAVFLRHECSLEVHVEIFTLFTSLTACCLQLRQPGT